MKIIQKQFTPGLVENVDQIRNEIERRFKIPLEQTTHVHLLCEKIASTRNLPGGVVQCGVWKGSSIFAAGLFCQHEGIQKTIVGFDTFGGFPSQEINPYDHPGYFKILRKDGLISKQHYEQAAERTKNFTDLSHLTTEYFLDIGEVFGYVDNFKNIKLVKGLFSETLPKFKDPIAVLYIDCDLYQGYKECLELLYAQVIAGGAVVFDEYYSRKYPGPRVAVNSFFANKKGHFEVYNTEEGFERWCFMKAE